MNKRVEAGVQVTVDNWHDMVAVHIDPDLRRRLPSNLQASRPQGWALRLLVDFWRRECELMSKLIKLMDRRLQLEGSRNKIIKRRSSAVHFRVNNLKRT